MDWLRKMFAPAPKRPLDLSLGRNDLCWCGSERKYKACHMETDRKEDAAKAAACSRYS